MKNLIRVASICGLLGVIFGAFGAHALKPVMTLAQADTFETAVKYQLIHSVSILVIALLYVYQPIKIWKVAGYLHLLGILLFSGSLYLLALKQLFGISHWTFLGPITPVGGLCFILGWIALFIGSYQITNNSKVE